MIFLLLDFLLALLSPFKTSFILLNILLIPKNRIDKLFMITLILDILILNTYFLNTLIIFLLFLFYKKLNIRSNTFFNYLLSLLLLFITFNLILALINNYDIFYFLKFLKTNLIINFIFYGLCYNLIKSRIKLSR